MEELELKSTDVGHSERKTPPTLIMRTIYVSFVVCILSVSAYAQGDTVEFRYLNSALPDSSAIFNFEFGQASYWNGSTLKFVDFDPPTGSLATEFFTTNPFSPNWSTDSISFIRWASFDDRHYKYSGVEMDSIQIDSLVDAWKVYYDTLKVRPFNSFFNSNSRIEYIIELRRGADSSILFRLDTLSCFLNLAGELRYRTPENTFAGRIFSLPNLAPGGMIGQIPVSTLGPVFFSISQVATLPQGSSLAHRGRESDKQVPMNGVFTGSYQEFFYPSMKPISDTRTSASLLEVDAIVTLDGKLVLEFQSERAGDVTIDLILIAEGRTFESTNIRIQKGKSSQELAAPRMSPQRYIIRVSSGNRTFIKKPLLQY